MTAEPDPAERAALGAALAGMPEVKRRQAHAADDLAAIASGIGEYGIANACYRLAGILRRHAQGDYSSMTHEAVAAAERNRIADEAASLGAHYHGPDGQSAPFDRFLRAESFSETPPDSP